MRSLMQRLGMVAGGLLGALLLVLVLVLLGANTDSGRTLVARLVPRFTGGTVRIAGLSGTLPGNIRVRRLVLADASGPWLIARDVVLDWRPLRLLGGSIVIDRLTAPEAHLIRLPAEQPETSRDSPAQPERPIPIVVHELEVRRLDVGPALAGHAIDLAVTGSGARARGGVERLKIDAEALGGGGRYRIDAIFTPGRVALTAHLREPANGLLAGLMGLALPGPIRLEADLAGPRSAIAINAEATAGALFARASGRIDLAARAANLVLSASAPAMEPRPGISWRSATLDARLDGPFATPELDGNLDLTGVSAAGATISRISARLSGSRGSARLRAELSGVVLPGPSADLLAKAPLRLDLSARLDAPGRPVSFTLRHPLIVVQGEAKTAGAPRLAATIDLPDLAPLAALGGVEVSGSGSITLSANRQRSGLALFANGALALRGGETPILPLLGAVPRISLAAGLHGDTVTLTRFSLHGRAVSMQAHGRVSAANIALAWQGTLSDVGSLDPDVKGNLAAQGTLEGRTDALALAAELGGVLGTVTLSPRQFRATLSATGLPAAPHARLRAETDLAGAPLDLLLTAEEGSGNNFAVTFDEARWKSVRARGTLRFGATVLPAGRITFSAGRLGDLSSLVATPLGGSADGSLVSEATQSGPRLVLDLKVGNLTAAGASIGNARLAATLLDPLSAREIDATLRLQGLSAGGVQAVATISAHGPLAALALRLNADSASFGAAHLSAQALADVTAGSASLSLLAADWRGEAIRLLQPARVVFSSGLAIEGLRLGAAGAELDAGGEVSPKLALTLALHDATPALLAPFLPGLAMKGRLESDARLTGSLAAPSGVLRIRVTNLGLSSGLAAGLPAANFDLTAALAGDAAQIRGALAAGRGTRLAVSGTVPLTARGALDLAVDGKADLALIGPVLTAGGRRIGGRLALDATARGPLASPTIAGTASLGSGMVSDYRSGLALTEISGNFAIAGSTVQIRSFEAHAGPGTIRLAGSVGIREAGIPVSLSVSARDAELLQSDLITVRLDSDLALTGAAERKLRASGEIHVRRAEIRIPNSLPPDIAVLNVVRPGSKPTPHESNRPDIALDVTLVAPREVFVRGRGVDAEFGGLVHVSGTLAAPVPEGSFHLIRGQVSLGGQTLAFNSGTIGFNGGDPADPALDLVATASTRTTTATLTLTGTVSKPKVTLSSVPQLPQDQVLEALLFGTSAASLSPFQLAEIANGLASLTGTGPSIGDPLGALRKGLGLDQLSIGSDASGKAAVQAGRYIAPGVYLGASQSTAGGGAQAQVKIDLTKHLKLDATVGNGGGSATAIGSAAEPNTRNGSSVGLTYQFEY